LNFDCRDFAFAALGRFGLIERQAAAQDNHKDDEPDLAGCQ
jgi:hypothetical protein